MGATPVLLRVLPALGYDIDPIPSVAASRYRP